MKQQSIYIILLFVTSLLGGCTDIDKGNPYEDQLHTLQVTAVYPDDYAEYLREGITVQIEDIDLSLIHISAYTAYKSAIKPISIYSTDWQTR